MSDAYEALLIVPAGRLNAESDRFLDDNAPNLNRLQRPRIGLGEVNGVSVLQFASNEDQSLFTAAVDHELERGRTLTVLTPLLCSQVAVLQGDAFDIGGRFFRFLTKCAPQLESPYFRRLLEIEQTEPEDVTGPVRTAQIGLSDVLVPPLYVDPQSINMTSESAAARWRTRVFAKADFGVLPLAESLLPPKSGTSRGRSQQPERLFVVPFDGYHISQPPF
jgi:hypothetical protein